MHFIADGKISLAMIDRGAFRRDVARAIAEGWLRAEAPRVTAKGVGFAGKVEPPEFRDNGCALPSRILVNVMQSNHRLANLTARSRCGRLAHHVVSNASAAVRFFADAADIASKSLARQLARAKVASL